MMSDSSTKLIALFVACFALAVSAGVAHSPIEAIRALDQQLDSYKVGANLSAEDLAYNRTLKSDVMKGTFDIGQLSKESLGKHWETLSEADRTEFVRLMTELLQKKAIFSKEQVQTQDKPYQVSYQKEVFLDPEKTQAEVFTVIDVPSEEVRLNINYKLKKWGDEWKIFDVIVDDASLVRNYAYQFNAIITKHGYPELTRRMQEKLTELESKQKGFEPPPSAAPIAKPPEKPLEKSHGFFSCSL